MSIILNWGNIHFLKFYVSGLQRTISPSNKNICLPWTNFSTKSFWKWISWELTFDFDVKRNSSCWFVNGSLWRVLWVISAWRRGQKNPKERHLLGILLPFVEHSLLSVWTLVLQPLAKSLADVSDMSPLHKLFFFSEPIKINTFEKPGGAFLHNEM